MLNPLPRSYLILFRMASIERIGSRPDETGCWHRLVEDPGAGQSHDKINVAWDVSLRETFSIYLPGINSGFR